MNGRTTASLSFRFKLALAMVLLIGGTTGACLWLTRRTVDADYREFLAGQFEQQAALFLAKQQARQTAARRAITDATRNVRLVAALQAEVWDRFYSDLAFEMGGILDLYRADSGNAGETGGGAFFRFIGPDGVLPTSHGRAGQVPGWSESDLDEALAELQGGVEAAGGHSGYLALGPPQAQALYEMMVVPLHDRPTGELLGTVVLGVPRPILEALESHRDFLTGLWVDGHLYGTQLTATMTRAVAERPLPTSPTGQPRELTVDGDPFLLFERVLPSGPGFPAARQVALLPLAGLHRLLRDIDSTILAFGGTAVAFGLLLSYLAAHRLTAPINALVRGTEEVGRGRLDLSLPVLTGDEIGRLTGAFNEMVAGLALKEKYRAVLDKVTDREVAEQLTRGDLTLGGEERETTVLFCDVRGFTPLTARMPPSTVIEMLNEHMTALTRVAYAHHGVVDKFVGDSIMVLFGAPRSYGDDPAHAARCALAMIAQRERLNRVGRWDLQIGIGLASGRVVAGCMGSEERLSYTVLGERVNLAARLCSKAYPMEILVCPQTAGDLRGRFQLAPRSDLSIKGYAETMTAFTLGPESTP